MNISAELSEISSYGGFFALTVGGDATGWHPVSRSYADGFADLIDATVQRYRTTELRIGASLVHLGHAARLWSPVLACALAHGVIPDLTDLQRADDGAQLRLPDPAGEPVTCGRDSPPPDLLSACIASSCKTTWNRWRPACASNWRPVCCTATSRPRSSERPKRCCRRGPTCAGRSLAITNRLLGTGAWPDPARSPARIWTSAVTAAACFYRCPVGGKCGDCAL